MYAYPCVTLTQKVINIKNNNKRSRSGCEEKSTCYTKYFYPDCSENEEDIGKMGFLFLPNTKSEPLEIFNHLSHVATV